MNFSNYNESIYRGHIENDGVLIGSTPEIEQLRPKSPVLRTPLSRINNYPVSQTSTKFNFSFLPSTSNSNIYNP